MIYLKLFWDFFKVSCFTFGGAYGAIPLIRDMVLGNNWISDERLTYMIAVSESTPGPIIVNLATYIGNQRAGFWGSLIATVGVVLPAYLVVILIVSIMKNAIKNQYVQAVLQGLKPCVTGIVLATGVYMVIHNILSFSGSTVCDIPALILTVLLTALMVFFPKIAKKTLSPIALICISAILGIVIYAV